MVRKSENYTYIYLLINNSSRKKNLFMAAEPKTSNSSSLYLWPGSVFPHFKKLLILFTTTLVISRVYQFLFFLYSNIHQSHHLSLYQGIALTFWRSFVTFMRCLYLLRQVVSISRPKLLMITSILGVPN